MVKKVAVVAFFSFGLLSACRSAKQDGPSRAEATQVAAVKEASVVEVAKYVREKSAVVFDANGMETRKEYGVVPGAVLLSSSKEYALDVLPPEKATKLVFYCGGVMCRASDSAAARAASAGYSDVSVMREGIKGWKGAGQPTEMPRS